VAVSRSSSCVEFFIDSLLSQFITQVTARQPGNNPVQVAGFVTPQLRNVTPPNSGKANSWQILMIFIQSLKQEKKPYYRTKHFTTCGHNQFSFLYFG